MKGENKSKKKLIDDLQSSGQRVAESENNKAEHVTTEEPLRESERKQIENTLASEHERLLSILDGSPISTFVIDSERLVTAWNMVNEFFTGISKEEVLGKPLDLNPLFKDKTPPSLAVLVLEMTDEEIIRRYAHKGIWKSKIHPEAFESTGSIWIKEKEHIMAIQATRLRDAAGNVIGAIQCAEDITEQRRAEEVLRESEELYRTALESPNDGVAIIQDGRYVYLNQKLLDTLGRNKDEMMAKAVGATMHPDDRVIVLDYYDRYQKGLPTPDHFEVRVYKPDGTLIYAEVTPVQVAYKGKKSLLAYLRNITEHKRAEGALRHSRQMLQNVLDNFPGVVFWKDHCSVYQGCNRAFATAAGINDPHEITGKTDYDMPWAQTEAEEYRKKDREVIEGGVPRIRIIESQHEADGRVGWYETSKIPLFDETGKVIGVLGVSGDITERKRMERELRESEGRHRLTLEAINDGLWDWDIRTGNAVFSPRWYSMLGYEPYELPQSYDSWRSLVHPEDIERAEREINAHITSGEGYAIDIRMRTKSGGWRWILTRGKVVESDTDGRPIRMVGTHSDITDERIWKRNFLNPDTNWNYVFVRERPNLRGLIVSCGQSPQSLLQCRKTNGKGLRVNFMTAWDRLLLP